MDGSDPDFDRIVAAIDAELDHLHKQRWAKRAAELHDGLERAEGDDREQAERALSNSHRSGSARR